MKLIKASALVMTISLAGCFGGVGEVDNQSGGTAILVVDEASEGYFLAHIESWRLSIDIESEENDGRHVTTIIDSETGRILATRVVDLADRTLTGTMGGVRLAQLADAPELLEEPVADAIEAVSLAAENYLAQNGATPETEESIAGLFELGGYLLGESQGGNETSDGIGKEAPYVNWIQYKSRGATSCSGNAVLWIRTRTRNGQKLKTSHFTSHWWWNSATWKTVRTHTRRASLNYWKAYYPAGGSSSYRGTYSYCIWNNY